MTDKKKKKFIQKAAREIWQKCPRIARSAGYGTEAYIDRDRAEKIIEKHLDNLIDDYDLIIQKLPKDKLGNIILPGMKIYWESICPETLKKGLTVVSIGEDETEILIFDGKEHYYAPYDFGIYINQSDAIEAKEKIENQK